MLLLGKMTAKASKMENIIYKNSAAFHRSSRAIGDSDKHGTKITLVDPTIFAHTTYNQTLLTRFRQSLSHSGLRFR